MGPDPTGIIAFSEARGVRVVAYGALGEPTALVGLLSNPTVRRIAEAHGRDVAAVALKWNLQSGLAASVTPAGFEPTLRTTVVYDAM